MELLWKLFSFPEFLKQNFCPPWITSVKNFKTKNKTRGGKIYWLYFVFCKLITAIMTELETKSSDSESENCEEEYQLDLDSDEEVRKDINES